jgi:hypothetical protein
VPVVEEVLKSVVLSLVTVAATMCFKAIETALLGQTTPSQIVAIQYELVIIAATVTISARAAAPRHLKDLFFEPLLWVGVVALLMVTLAALVVLFGAGQGGMMYTVWTVWLPDILGFVAIGRAVYATREASSG